jgi:hypothetical protein
VKSAGIFTLKQAKSAGIFTLKQAKSAYWPHDVVPKVHLESSHQPNLLFRLQKQLQKCQREQVGML